jgi:hypothetical protein
MFCRERRPAPLTQSDNGGIISLELVLEVCVMTVRSAELPSEQPVTLASSRSPHLIHDAHGQVVGVILPYADYQSLLRSLAAHADWESLPPYLQDAIDNLLADEALAEAGPSRPLRELLAEVGESQD